MIQMSRKLEVSVDHLRNLKLDFDVTVDGETIVEKNHPLTPLREEDHEGPRQGRKGQLH